MGFILEEEWPDKDNPYRFHTIPLAAGPFATKAEAEAEKQKRKPLHADGYIRVKESSEAVSPAKKRPGKKATRARVNVRRNRR